MDELFSHKRSEKDLERYMQLWPQANRDDAANAEFNGKASCDSGICGTIVIVHLYDGEQIHIFVEASDQSGAVTAMRIMLDVDNASLLACTVGGRGPWNRLVADLPVEAQEVIAEWGPS